MIVNRNKIETIRFKIDLLVYIDERITRERMNKNICVKVIRLVAGWTFSILRERKRRKDNGLLDKTVTSLDNRNYATVR